MDINNYPPLKLLKASIQPGKEFTSRKKQFMNLGIKGADKLTNKSYMELFYNRVFMNPYIKHPYMDLDRAFYQNIDIICQTTGLSEEELMANKAERLKTEIKDLYLAPVLIEEWSKCKQVFKPDPDFSKALLKTQKLQITKNMICHLPYKSFYIDLMDCEIFSPIVGIFTFIHHIMEDNKCIGADITIYILTEKMRYFSHYFSGIYDDNGIIQVRLSDEEDVGYEIWDQESNLIYDAEEFSVDRNQVSLFALQLICYLSIEEPQLTPSDYTKGTYIPKAPGAKVKNKWNEVQITDVGIRYGKTYRDKISEYRQNTETTEKRHHKSPIPHMRAAHWHKYWVGEGRTELKFNWVEPTFVGAKESKDIVIHKV